MTADGTPGPKNNPQFLDGGAPDLATDANAISTYAALVGNRKALTKAQREALTGKDVWTGLEVEEIDTGLLWKRIGGSWVIAGGGHELSPWGGQTPTANAFPIFKARPATGTTNAGGVLAHTFPTPFPNALDWVGLTLGNNSGVGTAAPVVVDGSVSRTGFSTFWAGRGSAAVGVFYFAVGH